jgi:signal peptidase
VHGIGNMKKIVPIIVLIATVYLLTNLVIPTIFKSETIFLADAVVWATAILATIFLSKTYATRIWKTNTGVLQFSAMIATFQIVLAVFFGFFQGFGKNPAIWNPTTIAIYLPYLLIPFLAAELSRTYLTKNVTKSKAILNLVLISLFYTLIITPTSTYVSLTTPLAISEFLIKTFIPTLATSLLASYFALLGGFPATFTYMAIPTFFNWFSPILPNPLWQVQSLITVATASLGFITLDATIKSPLTKKVHRTLKKEKSHLPQWTLIALIGLIAVWSSTGLLGFTPTIVASQSMQPTLNPGDITLIINTPHSAIQIGDIIQYQTANGPIIHRVIDKYQKGSTLWFVTQGDANNAADKPVMETDVMGKVVLTIPQLGWVSVTLKEAAATTYTFLTTTVPQILTTAWTWITTNGVFITSALAFTAYSYLLLTYKTIKKEEKT